MDILDLMREQGGDDLAHIDDSYRNGDFELSISEKLSWEIVAMNDHGDYSEQSRIALEIAYGCALMHDDPGEFMKATRLISEQLSDKRVANSLRQWTARGLKK